MSGTDVAVSEEEAFEAMAALGGDVAADAGLGNENLTKDDIAIPYISILQKGSPQCDEDHQKYIDGVKPGAFFQNVNLITWPGRMEAIELVPVAYEKVVIEWIPREAGGGMVGIHEVNTPLMKEASPNDKGVPTLPNGHNLVETAQHYMLYRFHDRWEPCMVSMKSTALKKSRLLNSLLSQQVIPGTQNPAPRWLYVWNTTTVLEQKDDNTWYNFEFERGRIIDKDGYEKAKTLYESFKKGLVRGVENGEDDIPF